MPAQGRGFVCIQAQVGLDVFIHGAVQEGKMCGVALCRVLSGSKIHARLLCRKTTF